MLHCITVVESQTRFSSLQVDLYVLPWITA